MNDGATATAQLCAYTRVGCYDFVVTNGLYPSEVSWTIETQEGLNVYDVNGAKARGDAGENSTFCSMPTPVPTSSRPSPVPTPLPLPHPMHLPPSLPLRPPLPHPLPLRPPCPRPPPLRRMARGWRRWRM